MIETTYDNIMVKMIHEEKMGSFYVPDTAKQYHGDFYGIVVSVGVTSKAPLKKGDKILFQRHEGREILHEGEKLIVLRPDHISAKVE